jgi:hypothetical protein
VDASKASSTAAQGTSKPDQSADLAGDAQQSLAAGNHSASGAAAGSLDAQHAKGSTAAAATGTVSDSLN